MTINNNNVFLWKKISHIENENISSTESSMTSSYFGNKISISNCGSVYVIGNTHKDNERGEVTVYENGKLLYSIKGENEGDMLGHSFNISGNGKILVLGEPYFNGNVGRVRIFNLDTHERFAIEGEIDKDEYFGWDVEVDYNGDTIAFLVNSDTNGYVNVYKSKTVDVDNNTASSTLTAASKVYVEHSTIQDTDHIPLNLCLNGSDGNIIGVAYRMKSNEEVSEGCVKFYKNDCTETLENTYKEFGSAPINGVSLDGLSRLYKMKLNSTGDTFVLGENSFSTFKKNNIGRVRVFKYCETGCNWNLLGNEFIGENVGDCLGSSVDISSEGNVIVFGEQSYSDIGISASGTTQAVPLTECGRVRAFEYIPSSNSFKQIGQSIQGEGNRDNAGVSVKIDDNHNLFIGEPLYAQRGRVRIFEKSYEVGVLLGDGESILSLKPESYTPSNKISGPRSAILCGSVTENGDNCESCNNDDEDIVLIEELNHPLQNKSEKILTAIIDPLSNEIVETYYEPKTNKILKNKNVREMLSKSKVNFRSARCINNIGSKCNNTKQPCHETHCNDVKSIIDYINDFSCCVFESKYKTMSLVVIVFLLLLLIWTLW